MKADKSKVTACIAEYKEIAFPDKKDMTDIPTILPTNDADEKYKSSNYWQDLDTQKKTEEIAEIIQSSSWAASS